MPVCPRCGSELAWVGEYGQYYCHHCQMYLSQMPPPVKDDTSKALMLILLIPLVLVIIVIVVAAVLYVMVIGFGGPGDFISTPVGTWQGAEATSATSGELTFGTFITDVEPLDLRLYVEENGTYVGYLTWNSNTASAPAALTWNGGPTGASATYTDYNPAGGEVNAGDHIIFEGLTPGTTYSFELYHIPSDSDIMMTGYDEFTTDS